MTPLANSLTQLSARRIAKDLEALRKEKAQIEAQEALLQEVLRLKEDYARNGSDGKKRQGASTTRDSILGVLRAEPDREWAPREINEALRAAGSQATPKSVGVMLVRMVQSGQLTRVGKGKYKLASEPGRDENPALGAPNLGQLAVNEPTPSRSLVARDD